MEPGTERFAVELMEWATYMEGWKAGYLAATGELPTAEALEQASRDREGLRRPAQSFA